MPDTFLLGFSDLKSLNRAGTSSQFASLPLVQVAAARVGPAAALNRSATVRRLAQNNSPMAAANVNVQVTNGVTSQVQTVGNTVTSYAFSTPDGYTCRTDAAMNWSCTLNGVPVVQIPVILIPIISEF